MAHYQLDDIRSVDEIGYAYREIWRHVRYDRIWPHIILERDMFHHDKSKIDNLISLGIDSRLCDLTLFDSRLVRRFNRIEIIDIILACNARYEKFLTGNMEDNCYQAFKIAQQIWFHADNPLFNNSGSQSFVNSVIYNRTDDRNVYKRFTPYPYMSASLTKSRGNRIRIAINKFISETFPENYFHKKLSSFKFPKNMSENFNSEQFVTFLYQKIEELAEGKINVNQAMALCKMAAQINVAKSNEIRTNELALKEKAFDKYLELAESGMISTPNSIAKIASIAR